MSSKLDDAMEDYDQAVKQWAVAANNIMDNLIVVNRVNSSGCTFTNTYTIHTDDCQCDEETEYLRDLDNE